MLAAPATSGTFVGETGRRAHQAAAALFAPVRTGVTDSLGTKTAQVHRNLRHLRTILDDARAPLTRPGRASL
jgi:hypothetical protein